jgi:hypothetical protein
VIAITRTDRARTISEAGPFDLLIVGAGPAAAATLMGLEEHGRICVVTGAATIPASNRYVHPKIRAVATRRGEPAGITDPIAIAGAASPAFSTATVGGLANYWGQQFIRYLPTDPWPRDVFDSYEEYQTACARIETAFNIDETNKPTEPGGRSIAPYHVESPRLLVGTADDPALGLMSMRRTMEQLLAHHNATTIAARVESLAPNGAIWQARLTDGRIVAARRIVLAAGVLGTATLLMRSFPEINSIRLRDHAPWMLYVRGLERLVLTTRSGKDPNFNVQSIFRDTESGPALFGTIYNLRYADLNLILATLTGRSIPALAGLRTPWPADLIKPVQVWTDATLVTVEIDRHQRNARIIAHPLIAADRELARFRAILSDNGVSILKTGATPALQGFHYFGLEVLIEHVKPRPVEDFLAERCRNEIHCLDASTLRDIGCRPPLETSMARALTLAFGLPH